MQTQTPTPVFEIMNQQSARHRRSGVINDSPSCESIVTFRRISDHCFNIILLFHQFLSIISIAHSQILTHLFIFHNAFVQFIQIFLVFSKSFCQYYIILVFLLSCNNKEVLSKIQTKPLFCIITFYFLSFVLCYSMLKF